ncbi:HAD family hydrolase [Pedobacter deserti]|uniref:HAD family hydrolase n=1 Tax=Pedobacter deserti TaxID=2817382 RepID=UPI00210C0B9C|nr:HAD hydrolase-like protein [Pedobacter sp. SYSU D00382]
MLEKYKVLLWDFDGVIMDSMPVRSNGFSAVLKEYPEEQISQLMDFHNLNGGLSRYVKFRYFFEAIRGEVITEAQVNTLAKSFSEIMLASLVNKDLLIKDAVGFIEQNWNKYEMHIVSGSDGVELNAICQALNLARFFETINGSPTPKNKLVGDLLDEYEYKRSECVLIGDSINDYEAAATNGIDFIGYNNQHIKNIAYAYIENFEALNQ